MDVFSALLLSSYCLHVIWHLWWTNAACNLHALWYRCVTTVYGFWHILLSLWRCWYRLKFVVYYFINNIFSGSMKTSSEFISILDNFDLETYLNRGFSYEGFNCSSAFVSGYLYQKQSFSAVYMFLVLNCCRVCWQDCWGTCPFSHILLGRRREVLQLYRLLVCCQLLLY